MFSRHAKTLVLLAVINFLLIPFNSYAMEGTINNGWYYSADRLFIVKVPTYMTNNQTVTDDKFSVHEGTEFVSFKSIYGTFDLTWGPYKGTTQVMEKKFYKINRKGLPDYLQHQFSQVGQVTTEATCHSLQINNQQAYQCVQQGIIQNIGATMVGTAVLYPHAMAISTGIFPGVHIPWNDYNTFTSSIKALP